MTLYRIEQGEASVTIGAYLSVISVLGLKPKLVDVNQRSLNSKRFKLNDDTLIPLSEYPQLKKLAWQLNKSELTPQEALNLYERNWRYVNVNEMSPKERELIQSLLFFFW